MLHSLCVLFSVSPCLRGGAFPICFSTSFLILAGCGSSATHSPRPSVDAADDSLIVTAARFREMTTDAGISFTPRNGQEAGQFAILETLGTGVALFDYDGDG